MDWQELCEHPNFQNLPFKIELDENGRIRMSPTKVYHSLYQGRITRLLRKDGEVFSECAIQTRKGIKVADVAWASAERSGRIEHETSCSIAPEICVEIYSEGNTDHELAEKKALYFERGAEEVWFCLKNGSMQFYSAQAQLPQSRLCPDFPAQI
jgi:Uma2 family endonuclease